MLSGFRRRQKLFILVLGKVRAIYGQRYDVLAHFVHLSEIRDVTSFHYQRNYVLSGNSCLISSRAESE